MNEDMALLEAPELELWLETPSPDDHNHKGFMSLQNVTIPGNASAHLRGLLAFMRSIRSPVLAAEVPADRIHYKVFGPNLWLAGV